MGIDIYMRWNNQSKDEQEAQYTGFRTDCGDAGYLREAYHGGPYATRVLVPEAFAAVDYDEAALITADTLESRLDAAIAAAMEREQVIYGASPEEAGDAPMVQSLRDFVALARQKETETGEPVRIEASY